MHVGAPQRGRTLHAHRVRPDHEAVGRELGAGDRVADEVARQAGADGGGGREEAQGLAGDGEGVVEAVEEVRGSFDESGSGGRVRAEDGGVLGADGGEGGGRFGEQVVGVAHG